MRMPRFRFSVRRMMVAVAIVGLILGIASALIRREPQEPMPRDAGEAVVYLRRSSPGLFRGDYDLEVRCIPHSEAVGDLYNVAFKVTVIRRERVIRWDGAGATTAPERVYRQVILIMEDGYCMHVKINP